MFNKNIHKILLPNVVFVYTGPCQQQKKLECPVLHAQDWDYYLWEQY